MPFVLVLAWLTVAQVGVILSMRRWGQTARAWADAHRTYIRLIEMLSRCPECGAQLYRTVEIMTSQDSRRGQSHDNTSN